jgi:8-amino-7-oxononanoate synthase
MNEIAYTHASPGRTVILRDSEEFLWFSGTDYLGMGHNQAFQSFLYEGLEQYGTHYGSSRNGSLRLTVYEDAEESLAAFADAPAALAVSSGMWAGQLVMKVLDELSAEFHYAPRVHPALWGRAYVPEPGTWEEWARKTLRRIETSAAGTQHVVCTDSVGSPWVEKFDLEVWHGLPDNRQIWLVVDDSHGLGVLGKNGQGVFSLLPQKNNIRSIVTSSLNKALGVPGGVVFGEDDTIQVLRRTPWFAGSSPSAPGYFYALQKNLSFGIYQKAHQTLLSNLDYLTKRYPVFRMFDSLPHYPAFCSRRADLYPFLYQNQILTSRFSYPLPTDEPVMRLVVTALHQKQDLDRLAEVLLPF